MQLFPAAPEGDAAPYHTTGILPFQTIKELVRAREVMAPEAIDPAQFQPASLDLRLGSTAYRVRASFLAGGGATVMQKIEEFGMHEIDLARGAVLERGCVYVVRLMESLALGSRVSAAANPKSSTGRLDVFTRLIADNGTAFDRVERGYDGPLYLEVAPRTFSIEVRRGSRLNQLRFRRGQSPGSETALRRLHERYRLVDAAPGAETIRSDRIGVTLDLAGDARGGLLGYKAKKHADVIDVDARGRYDPLEFWDPIPAGRNRRIILDPDDFYILATKEAVKVPPDHAAEMVAYDTMVGEFRVHYAGFFDPGFGYDPAAPEAPGTKAVLEVRSHDVPFVLEHEQIIGWLRYERLTGPTDRLYGAALGSSYQSQGLTLGKQFKPLA
jgi:dCTP deaminase